jgi:hypothetical protein
MMMMVMMMICRKQNMMPALALHFDSGPALRDEMLGDVLSEQVQ